MKKILLPVLLFILMISCKDNPTEPEKIFTLDTEWVEVPKGTFKYGEKKEIRELAYSYSIMKYEVTNLEYCQYLNEAFKEQSITVEDEIVWGIYGEEGMDTDTYKIYNLKGDPSYSRVYNRNRLSFDGEKFNIPDGFENHPVMFATYYGAAAFAKHYRLELPNEYEWEKAARGDKSWDYPWGNTIDPSIANYAYQEEGASGSKIVGYYDGSIRSHDQTKSNSSVFGAFDMCGNAFEWISSYDTFQARVRIIRGGSWAHNDYWLKCWFSHYHSPGYSAGYLGFRCVKK